MMDTDYVAAVKPYGIWHLDSEGQKKNFYKNLDFLSNIG